MTGAEIFRLVLLILVGLVWAGLVWRTYGVWATRAQSNGTSTGREVSRWFKAAEDRRERNTVLFLTFAFVVMLAT